MKNKLFKRLRINRKLINDIDMIERYNEGKLHGEYLEKFESRMKSDIEFASDVKLCREIDEFLRSKSEYIQLYEQLEHIYEKVILKKRMPST
jgi:hypothetical protein